MIAMDDVGPLDFLLIELPAGTRAYPRRVVREVTRLSESEPLASAVRRSGGEWVGRGRLSPWSER